MRRNVANRKSTFYGYLPKYGASGASILIAARLWYLPSMAIFLVSMTTQLVSGPHTVVRHVSYGLFAFFLVCASMMIVRAMSARKELRKFEITKIGAPSGYPPVGDR